MKTYLHKLGVGAGLLALGIWFLTGAGRGTAADKDAQVPISDGDFEKLVESLSKQILEGLDGKPDAKKGKVKARTLALMVAAGAKLGGGERAGVGEAALKLADSIKNDDKGGATKIAKTLAATKNGSGKVDTIKVGDQLEIDDLMHQFSLEKAGGLGIEKTLQNLGSNKKRELDKKDVNEKLKLLALHTAIIAEVAKTSTPDKDAKLWEKYAEDLRKSALELADAKTGKAAYTSVNKVNKACNDCHEKFR